MTLVPDAIDQSWGNADPSAIAKAGIKLVSMYLSNDSSKNITASKTKAYHAHGTAVQVNWEAVAGAPLKGAAQGHADATSAVAQVRALIKAVGYAPKNKMAIIFSCDRDTTPANYAVINAYYAATKAVVHAAGFLNGVYGEKDLIEHLHAAGLTDVEWQTYAWSGGELSPQADLYQFHNGQTLAGASVDFDKIEHASTLGAWWPPNSPYNVAPGPVVHRAAPWPWASTDTKNKLGSYANPSQSVHGGSDKYDPGAEGDKVRACIVSMHSAFGVVLKRAPILDQFWGLWYKNTDADWLKVRAALKLGNLSDKTMSHAEYVALMKHVGYVI